MSAMTTTYELLTVRHEGAIRRITIDAPPVNLMTGQLFAELLATSAELAEDDGALVAVIESADPDVFIAHFDVELILQFPRDGSVDDIALPMEHNAFHVMCERFRTMPVVTIAKIAGRVGGGGAELAAAMDMRFGTLDTTVLCQMEVPLGIIPGGGGTQRIPQLVGRGRAMEIVLGGDDVDAATLERWGWLNRALPADELDGFVERLASRIASFPPDAVRLAKAAVLDAAPDPTAGLLAEQQRFQQSLRTPGAWPAMSAFIANGGQTRPGELNLQHTLTT
jgi:enoyl-CoA hydratase/carnithine racemase